MEKKDILRLLEEKNIPYRLAEHGVLHLPDGKPLMPMPD